MDFDGRVRQIEAHAQQARELASVDEPGMVELGAVHAQTAIAEALLALAEVIDRANGGPAARSGMSRDAGRDRNGPSDI